MNYSEKDMEDCIWANPDRFLCEEGLRTIERQVNLDGYRADLLFEDSNGSYLLVEVQKGGLDRTHIWKILDYGFRLKKKNGHKQIRLMVVANRIRNSQIETLNHLRVEYKQIPESEFKTINNVLLNPPVHESEGILLNVKGMQNSIFDRVIDGRYFGFSGNRAIAASLYARNEGASQEEVNSFMSELTNQKGFYNMLAQANQWGHDVAVWHDPIRGKIFKLKFNPDHSAKTTIKPPENWQKLNECSAPPGAIIDRYVRN